MSDKENASREESREHHHHHHHHHHRRRRKKKLGSFLFSKIHLSDSLEEQLKRGAVFALVLLAVLALLYAVRRWENRRDFFHEGSPAADAYAAAEANSVGNKDNTEESGYRARLGIHTYLFMGVDNPGPVELSLNDGGQADAIMVLVVDDLNKTWQTLTLNRDTIASVPVLSVTGQVIDRRNEQLALAYAYGDGSNKSCLNVAAVVSKILEGQKINGYAALNMGGISAMNDALGGVTVTINSDFSGMDDTLVMGETITLNGTQAEHFLRGRKGVDDNTNLARMERHRQYLHGLREKLFELNQEDVLRIYEETSGYLVSSLDANDFANLLNTIKNYAELPARTIEGEAKIEDDLMAFYMDEESRLDVVLELFYEQK